MNTRPGDVGTGVEVLNTVRLHDEFVYKRYKDASTQQEFTTFEENTLTEVSKYFPDIQNSGVAEHTFKRTKRAFGFYARQAK